MLCKSDTAWLDTSLFNFLYTVSFNGCFSALTRTLFQSKVAGKICSFIKLLLYGYCITVRALISAKLSLALQKTVIINIYLEPFATLALRGAKGAQANGKSRLELRKTKQTFSLTKFIVCINLLYCFCRWSLLLFGFSVRECVRVCECVGSVTFVDRPRQGQQWAWQMWPAKFSIIQFN